MDATQKQIDLVATLLREETTLSLATTGVDGAPSIAPLFYIHDGELSLYWLSSRSSRHSQNLLAQPAAAAAVHCSADGWQQIRGVQLRGQALILDDPQLRTTLLKAYSKRFKLGKLFRLAIRRSDLFVLHPESIRYIDNTKGFGAKFELERSADGWTLRQPSA